MFIQYVMQPLVAQYKKFFPDEIQGQTAELRKAHTKVKEMLSKAMPVERAIFSMVVEKIPSPVQAQKYKVNTLALDYAYDTPIYLPSKAAIERCDTKEPLVIFVAKMQPFSSRLYDATTRSTTSLDAQRLVAVARVYSGTVQVGQKIFVLGPKHTLETPDITETHVEHLFLLMGSQFQLIERATAGCIVGIGGLDDILIKTGTITSNPEICPNFSRVTGLSMGLVRVAIEADQLS